MMMMEFSIFPVGEGESLSAAVAGAVALVRDSGLAHEVTDMGTIVEGSPAECLRLVERCVERMAESHGRLSCTVKIDFRKGGESRLGKKTRSVLGKLGA
jgi:uncharacterized protein YqgV (UPF0045/DUF77 family)